MKPFNLKDALAGHPVITRSGHMAYIRHVETDLDVGPYRLLGYVVHDIGVGVETWTGQGKYMGGGEGAKYDIEGMWEEPLTFDHWNAVDEKWQFIAEDGDGSRGFYDKRPVLSTTQWAVTQGYEAASALKWDTKGRGWRDTLVERPKP